MNRFWPAALAFVCLSATAATTNGAPVAGATTTQPAPAISDSAAPTVDLVLRNGARFDKCRLLGISSNTVELRNPDGKTVKVPGYDVQRIVFLPPEPAKAVEAVNVRSKLATDDGPGEFAQMMARYNQLKDKSAIERLPPNEEAELADLFNGMTRQPPPPQPGDRLSLEQHRDLLRAQLSGAKDNATARFAALGLLDTYTRMGRGPAEILLLLKSDMDAIKDDKVRVDTQDKATQEVKNRLENLRPRNILKRLDDMRENPPPPRK